jgi:hypothetical protein
VGITGLGRELITPKRVKAIKLSTLQLNQLVGEPPIADHLHFYLSTIEKIGFRKGAERNLHSDAN